MQLIFGREIKRALREISPTSIAVAYVGIDWADYVDASTIKEIVLSPTLGSNPYAIAKIADQLGWDNVHFLDNLHAKIYVGATGAAVGSFNLTANGLSAEGLEEAGYVVQGRTAIEQLRALLEQYKSHAQAAYPSTASKQHRLAELRALWDRATASGIIRNDANGTEFTGAAKSQGINLLRQLFADRISEAMDIVIGKKIVTWSIAGMLRHQHAVELAKRLVRSSELQSGLTNLARHNALEYSFESILLEDQFEPLFTEDDRACARFHLSEAIEVASGKSR